MTQLALAFPPTSPFIDDHTVQLDLFGVVA